MMVTGLDFETFSRTDIRSRGLDNYTADPSFCPLIAATATNDPKYFASVHVQSYDFVEDYRSSAALLSQELTGNKPVAHNADFERSVLNKIYPGSYFDLEKSFPWKGIIHDSAVTARALGVSGKLEAAAPQLLGGNKSPSGSRLIKKFSIGERAPLWDEVKNDSDWYQFKQYCMKDAELSLLLHTTTQQILEPAEEVYNYITSQMNATGWLVDVDSLELMRQRYAINQEKALTAFRDSYDPKGELNFASSKQLAAWCKERGMNVVSFTEEKVEYLINRVRKQIEKHGPQPNLIQILMMLHTKQVLGGSSLKKLETIANRIGPDNRLRNNYMHIGAGQSFRTSGVGVQMQNLKRLTTPRDMSTLQDLDEEWTNDDLAANIRQLFIASTPESRIIVADLKSIESRGLAWLAGAQFKLSAYAQGKDLYKVLAASMFGVIYEEVTKAQRQAGKVGELACGYQASSPAVAAFAQKMHIEMSEAEAADLVQNWRAANPEIVQLWANLDNLLHEAMTKPINFEGHLRLQHSYSLYMFSTSPLASVEAVHPGCRDLFIKLYNSAGELILTRVFRGAYYRGRNIYYHKPSELVSGPLWKATFVDPVTKRHKPYNLYGGKLAGILTQSLCRELFFRGLKQLHADIQTYPNLKLIGQFHDEVALEWNEVSDMTRDIALDSAVDLVFNAMTKPVLPSFPMDATVDFDYRYIK